MATNKQHYDALPGPDVISGDDSIWDCFWSARFRSQEDVAENVDDLDKAKMGLCRPFKTLIENCSVPIEECIGDIAVKEVVMTEFLNEMVEDTKSRMKIVEKFTSPTFFKGFTHEDCVIFGGDVAGAISSSAPFLQVLFFSVAAYALDKISGGI